MGELDRSKLTKVCVVQFDNVALSVGRQVPKQLYGREPFLVEISKQKLHEC